MLSQENEGENVKKKDSYNHVRQHGHSQQDLKVYMRLVSVYVTNMGVSV